MRFSTGMKATMAMASAGVLVLAGCGENSSGGNGVDGDGPIPIALIGDLTGPPGTAPFPDQADGARAAVKAVNAAGGVNGRELKLTVCDTNLVQTKALQCARNVVKSNAVAVVLHSQLQAAAYPVLASGKIPVINSNVLEAKDMRGDNVFPLTSGAAGSNRADGVAMAQVFKVRIPVAAYADVPAAGDFPKAVNSGLAAAGGPRATDIAVQVNAPDMSVYATRILSGKPDAVAIGSISGDVDRLTTALYERDKNVKFLRSDTVTPPASIKAIGPAAANTYLMSAFRALGDSGIPAVKEYHDGMTANDASWSPEKASASSAGPWSSVQLLAQAFGKTTETSRSDVATALENNVFNIGILPNPVQFKTPNPVCGEPRCFNTVYQLFQIRDGKPVPAEGADGGLVDAYPVQR